MSIKLENFFQNPTFAVFGLIICRPNSDRIVCIEPFLCLANDPIDDMLLPACDLTLRITS